MEDSHDEKRKEGGRHEIGDRGDREEERSGDHEFLFVNFQKGSSDKGFQNQRSEEKDSDKEADLRLGRALFRKIDRKRGDEDIENGGEGELSRKSKDEIAG